MNKRNIYKSHRYYQLLDSSGNPVNGMLKLMKRPPSYGKWVDVTSCLSGCCNRSQEIIASDVTLEMTDTPTVFDLMSLIDLSLSSGTGTITAIPFDITIDGINLVLDANGELTVTGSAPYNDAVSTPVTFQVSGSDIGYKTVILTINIELTQ